MKTPPSLDLFTSTPGELAPLAYRMRPQTLDDYVGQQHLLKEDKLLSLIKKAPVIPSLILWGPPGCGKTTLAEIIAKRPHYDWVCLSAVTAGIKEVKEVVEQAQKNLSYYQKRTVLFLDEIHRFNKAQQDALLPHIEKGTITLIGATTENPSFSIVGALLSRTRVLVLKPLSPEDLELLVNRALKDKTIGLGEHSLDIDPEAKNFLIETSYGDARQLLNNLESAANLVLADSSPKDHKITLYHVEALIQKRHLAYDKQGEEHYNVISAFIKSLRDSDPDAGLYYLARMLEAGEDPLFIARRMVIFSSEDIGNADPQALPLALAAMQAFDFVGLPEGWIPLAHAVTYLACAPKSNASYAGYKKALKDVETHGALPVPLHLRNAPTRFMKEQGYGQGYRYAHNEPHSIVHQQHLPDLLKDRRYYNPSTHGYEVTFEATLKKIRS